MPKHKQKAKKYNFLWARLRKRKPLLAALAFILIATPTSWMLVSAQPDNEKSGAYTELSGSSSDNAASPSISKDSSGHSAGTSVDPTDPDGKKAASQSAALAAQSAAGGSSSGTAGGSTSSRPATKATPQPTPTPSSSPNGWHDNIISTIFWVGEAADASNAHISNAESAWDGNWETHYGGFDDPNSRNGYYPAAFTPKENPFYFALPYNDLNEAGKRKATASNCPNTGNSISWCKNAWIKITKGGKTVYAQWQDVGPLQEDDTAYVFGTAAPKNTWGAKAGVDVSPAVRDYLGLGDVDRVGWGFVSAASVPAGPWKNIVTTNPGGW